MADAGPNGADAANADVGRHAFDDAKKVGNELLNAACEGVVGLFDEQRARAAAQVSALGDALRRSSEALDREGGIPSLGHYAGEAAHEVDAFAAALRSRTWGELATDVENAARRWPAAYIAATIALGVVGGRLLLSAAPGSPLSQHNMAPGQISDRSAASNDATPVDTVAGGPVAGNEPGIDTAREQG